MPANCRDGGYCMCTIEIVLDVDLTADPSDWAWTDVTAFVYQRDQIKIRRGRPDGATTTPASTCELTVDNSDGRWCAPTKRRWL